MLVLRADLQPGREVAHTLCLTVAGKPSSSFLPSKNLPTSLGVWNSSSFYIYFSTIRDSFVVINNVFLLKSLAWLERGATGWGKGAQKWKRSKNSKINLLSAQFGLKQPARWQPCFTHFPSPLKLISPLTEPPLTQFQFILKLKLTCRPSSQTWNHFEGFSNKSWLIY